MQPRTTDWSLALCVACAAATGLFSLVAGRPAQWWIFALHGCAGLWLAFLLVVKLRRVWWRVVPRGPTRWPATYRDPRTLAGVGATLLALATIGLGIGWVAGARLVVLGYNLLNWHIVAGILLTVVVSVHMLVRARPLRFTDLAGRRQALHVGSRLIGGIALWPAQQATQRWLGLPGATRRFTGSREVASFRGNAFPTTSWVADRPRPIPVEGWHLVIGGAVAHSLRLGYHDVAGDATLVATLDCTGGFYSTQVWRGAQVGALLDQAGLAPAARWVRFVSVTGYRWSLPLEEARAALLATHVGEEPLSHAHGAPARLVAPGQRGFVWVKWLVAVEALTHPDPGQLIAIHTSWSTPAGRGEI